MKTFRFLGLAIASTVLERVRTAMGLAEADLACDALAAKVEQIVWAS
jgi:hypothetical protein